ncbi:MAG TPA: hypothetical protein VE262_25815 [Blastocatellia bacterium]|nr:hypothetical protein [Blastocatellia bacterium]
MKGKNTDPDVPIMFQILAYLAENPDAEDSLEGITEWWILQQNIRVESRRVSTALKQLLEKELISEVAGLDNRTYYRINRSKYDQIKQLLKDIEL